jgi:hypothetical protein
MPLEYASDRWHREANERTLMGIEALTCLNQPGAGNLDQILLVFAAIHKAPGERFSQPEMGRHHLSNDPLPPRRARRLGSNEKIMSSGRKVLPGALLARKSKGSFGDRHQRVTLREEMRGVARFSATARYNH